MRVHFFKSEKKTDEGQLKQMTDALRIYSFFFGLSNIKFNITSILNVPYLFLFKNIICRVCEVGGEETD